MSAERNLPQNHEKSSASQTSSRRCWNPAKSAESWSTPAEKLRQIKPTKKEKRKIPSNQRRWSPVNVTDSWSHCLKHGTTIEKEKLRQIEAKEKEKLRQTKPKKEKNFVKSPLEPRQRNGFMVPCLKHGTTIEPTSKSGGNLITKSKPNKKENSSNRRLPGKRKERKRKLREIDSRPPLQRKPSHRRRLAEATVLSDFPIRDCARIVLPNVYATFSRNISSNRRTPKNYVKLIHACPYNATHLIAKRSTVIYTTNENCSNLPKNT